MSLLRRGVTVVIHLFGGEQVSAKLNLVQPEGEGIRVGGELTGPRAGSFSLSSGGTNISGRILLSQEQIAYVIAEQPDGQVLMQEKLLSDVICFPIPRFRGEPVAGAGFIPQSSPPLLSSRPEATAVLYMDFDGETVTDSSWNGGNTIVAQPSTLTSAQIIQVWNRVKEDYWPFNVDVTTDRARYNNAPVRRRMRCIITPTSAWYGEAGGVAYISSFSLAGLTYSASVPCWVFNPGPIGIAEAVSHEFGHTLGLHHDGRTFPVEEYYEGHGTGAVGWAPIMGVGYYKELVQWSKGEYANANNRQEDDIAIIAGAANNFGFVTDEAGNTRASAAVLNAPGGSVNQAGIITSASDLDYYAFTVGSTTTLRLNADPAAISPNLDLLIELQNNAGTLLASSNPEANLNASIEYTAAAGNYFIKVQGIGRGAVLADGYSNYGSIGHYSLSGTVTNVAPSIATQPASQSVSFGQLVSFSVVATGALPLHYQWMKEGVDLSDATNSTYAIVGVQIDDAGSYAVVVTNVVSSITSHVATLMVQVPPLITWQPTSRTNVAGTTASFVVTASGTLPLNYRWRSNGVSLPGAMGSSYAITNVQVNHAANYSVVVTNMGGMVTSAVATLTVRVPPFITAQPQNRTNVAGTTATFNVTATGSVPLGYQWRSNGISMEGATGNSYTISEVQPGHAAGYSAVVTNEAGGATSAVANLMVWLAPTIAVQPENQQLNAGSPVLISVMARGTEPLSYQWRKDNENVPGAISNIFSIASVQESHVGIYSVVVSNVAGAVVSSNASLSVIEVGAAVDAPQLTWSTGGNAPWVTQNEVTKDGIDAAVSGVISDYEQSWMETILIGPGSIAFWWKVSSEGGFDFLEFYVNGELQGGRISGEVGWERHEFFLGAGTHLVRWRYVKDNLVTLGEDRAWVDMVSFASATAPIITGQPQSRTNVAGVTADFNVVATGTGPISYQWRKDGSSLAGQTNVSLWLTNLQVGDAGDYSVMAANVAGSVASEVATLTIWEPPAITLPPYNQSITEGYSVTFSVTAKGTSPLSYRWRMNGADLPDASSSSYAITNVHYQDMGSYSVVVENMAGSIESTRAILTVFPPYTFVTVAGNAEPGGDDGTGSGARFDGPIGTTLDSSNTIYVADRGNQTIRRISQQGTVTTMAGLQGTIGAADGIGSEARFNGPRGVATDSLGNLYVSDSLNHTIRKVSNSGQVTTPAGLVGEAGSADGRGSLARFRNPSALAVGKLGDVYIADTENHVIRKMDAAGEVETLVGEGGQEGSVDGVGADARFYQPCGLAVDDVGNIYVADAGNHTIRKINPLRVVTTLAGLAGVAGSVDGAGNDARFNNPSSVAIDGVGNIYVTDTSNHSIRRVNPEGTVTTLAGLPGQSGSDDGIGSAVRFHGPKGIAVESTGTIYVTDFYNNRVRKGFLVNPTNLQIDLGSLQVISGLLSFDITGVAGQLFIIEVSPNLLPGSWLPVQTNALGSVPFHFSDLDAVQAATRYYRVTHSN